MLAAFLIDYELFWLTSVCVCVWGGGGGGGLKPPPQPPRLRRPCFILAQCIFQLQKQALYEFPVASRHKATATLFSTGIAHRMFMSCHTRYGLTKLQTNWNIFLEIRKCSQQIKRINTLMKRRSQDASFVCISRHYSN